MKNQGLKCFVVRTASEFLALKQDWLALELRCVSRLLPFQTYAWNKAWWATFGTCDSYRRNSLQILSFYLNGEIVAIYPLVETSVGIGPLRLIHYLRPFGADPNLTEIRSPLTLPEYMSVVLEWCVNYLTGPASEAAALHLIGPYEAVKTAELKYAIARAGNHRTVINYILDLPDSWENFRSLLKRNIKESLRRCYNSLKREGLLYDIKVLTNPKDLKQALPKFYQLHAERAALESTSVKHPDYFHKMNHRNFIESVIENMNEDANSLCRVHMFCLRIDEKVVAMRLAFRCENEMYFYYSGYDSQYAKFSVMTTLLAESFRWCIGQGLQRANLSVGTDVSKTRWGPQYVTYLETNFVKRSVRGRVLGVLLG